MKRVLLTTVLAVVVFAYPALGQPASRTKIFVFNTTEFWFNLHSFLYVLGRARSEQNAPLASQRCRECAERSGAGARETHRCGTRDVARSSLFLCERSQQERHRLR